MSMENEISVPFIKVTQPIGSFYIASMDFRDVLEIAKADVRTLDKDGTFDNYLGIQRKVSKKRQNEIASYCSTIDATFPTSVILSIQSLDENGLDNGNIRFENGKMIIKKAENVASILDGQHRLEGMKNALMELENTKFELNVTIFVDVDIDQQAQIFSVINKAQTKVNKSLVYDLYEYSVNRCPQKTAHDVVRILNRKKESPFYKKVKILGKAEDTETESIAQATFVEWIIKYISKDPMKDRDVLKRKSFFGKTKLEKISGDESRKLIFRNMFVENKDFEIVQMLFDFFSCVQEKWPVAWNENKDDNVLNKSTGLIALMKFLRNVYVKSLEQEQSFDTFCRQVFKKINIPDDSFTKQTYIPGTSGQSTLYKKLLQSLNWGV